MTSITPLPPDDMIPEATDATILAAVKQWGKDNNAAGRRFRIVTGGGKTP